MHLSPQTFTTSSGRFVHTAEGGKQNWKTTTRQPQQRMIWWDITRFLAQWMNPCPQSQLVLTVSRRFRPDKRASMNLSEVSQFTSDEMTLNSLVLICKSQWPDLYTERGMCPACSSVTEHLVLSDFHQFSKHAGPTVCPLVTFAV